MPTDFSKRLPGLEAREGRRGRTCGPTDSSESRSVSPEKGARQQHEDNRRGGGTGNVGSECGRSDSKFNRRSPGSSPEPEDNSSTSGDEGILFLHACTRKVYRFVCAEIFSNQSFSPDLSLGIKGRSRASCTFAFNNAIYLIC